MSKAVSGLEGNTMTVLAVKQIVEKIIKKNKKIYRAFDNLENAYDNESREKLWKC